jgi:uncharacterized protein with HEPN domain
LPGDSPSYLWDAREAAAAILEFTRGKTFEDYAADPILSAAVERKFMIIGEALGQAAKITPELASRIPDLRRVVGFRNILVHGYAQVQHATVWRAICGNLPELCHALDAVLADDQSPGCP